MSLRKKAEPPARSHSEANFRNVAWEALFDRKRQQIEKSLDEEAGRYLARHPSFFLRASVGKGQARLRDSVECMRSQQRESYSMN